MWAVPEEGQLGPPNPAQELVIHGFQQPDFWWPWQLLTATWRVWASSFLKQKCPDFLSMTRRGGKKEEVMIRKLLRVREVCFQQKKPGV